MLFCFAFIKPVSKTYIYYAAVPMIFYRNINILIPANTSPLLQAQEITEIYLDAALIF